MRIVRVKGSRVENPLSLESLAVLVSLGFMEIETFDLLFELPLYPRTNHP